MKNSGFTLIELVIVVFLVGALSLVVAKLLFGQDTIYHTQTMELGVTGDARAVLDDVDVYVRMSDTLVASQNGYTLDDQTLILKLPSINASSQIIAGTFDYVVYTLNGTNLDRVTIADAASSRASGTKRLASRVNDFAFTYDNGTASLVKYVTTDLTTQESYAGTPSRSITVSSKSKLRNN